MYSTDEVAIPTNPHIVDSYAMMKLRRCSKLIIVLLTHSLTGAVASAHPKSASIHSAISLVDAPSDGRSGLSIANRTASTLLAPRPPGSDSNSTLGLYFVVSNTGNHSNNCGVFI